MRYCTLLVLIIIIFVIVKIFMLLNNGNQRCRKWTSGMLADKHDQIVVYAGIYSEKYRPNYERLKKQLYMKGIPLTQIIFREVPQNIFSEKPNCYWCKKPCKFAFHHGENCKIVHQLELLRHYNDSSIMLVYLDADVQVANNWNTVDYFSMIKDVDIVFEQENIFRASPRWVSNVNIGFTLTKSTSKIIHFYENVLKVLNKKEPPLNWDQQVVNHLLRDNKDIKFKVTKNTGFIHTRSGGRG